MSSLVEKMSGEIDKQINVRTSRSGTVNSKSNFMRHFHSISSTVTNNKLNSQKIRGSVLQSDDDRDRESSMDLIATKKADIYSFRIGKAIINAFHDLYNKYIAERSQFEINISNDTKIALNSLFDATFFTLWCNNQSNKDFNILDEDPVAQVRQSSQLRLWHRIRKQSSEVKKMKRSSIRMHMKNKNKAQNKQESSFFIMAQFEKYKQVNEDDITQDELLQWLIEKLIVAMEPAVIEISILLKDSYSRFKRNDEKVFKKAVELAKVKQERSRNNSQVSYVD